LVLNHFETELPSLLNAMLNTLKVMILNRDSISNCLRITRGNLIMRTVIEIRLQNTRAQYYILRVFHNDKDVVPYIVHTSKVLSYLTKLVKERYSK